MVNRTASLSESVGDANLALVGAALIRALIDEVSCSPLDRRVLGRLQTALSRDVPAAVHAYERLLLTAREPRS